MCNSDDGEVPIITFKQHKRKTCNNVEMESDESIQTLFVSQGGRNDLVKNE